MMYNNTFNMLCRTNKFFRQLFKLLTNFNKHVLKKISHFLREYLRKNTIGRFIQNYFLNKFTCIVLWLAYNSGIQGWNLTYQRDQNKQHSII